MDQVTLMLQKSNERMKNIMEGKYEAAHITAAQHEFRGQVKLIGHTISAIAIATRNSEALTLLEKKNILKSGTAVVITEK